MQYKNIKKHAMTRFCAQISYYSSLLERFPAFPNQVCHYLLNNTLRCFQQIFLHYMAKSYTHNSCHNKQKNKYHKFFAKLAGNKFPRLRKSQCKFYTYHGFPVSLKLHIVLFVCHRIAYIQYRTKYCAQSRTLCITHLFSSNEI